MISRIRSSRTRLPTRLQHQSRRFGRWSGRTPLVLSLEYDENSSPIRGASGDDSGELLAVTNRIVNEVDLGALGSTHWKEGRDALEFWSTQPEDEDQSRRLLERLLEERQHLKATIGQYNELDSTEIVRRIVDRQLDQQEENQETALASWVEDLMDRFDVRPCDQVLSRLKIEARVEKENAPLGGEQEETSRLEEESPPPITQQSLEISNNSLPNEQATGPVLRTMSEQEDRKLAGQILLSFVKACNAAGINYDATERRVRKYIQNRSDSIHHESLSKQAFVFVLKCCEEVARQYEMSAKHGEMVLYEMLATYLEQNNLDVKPCRQCFASVVTIHSIRGDAQSADRVLQDMIHLYKRTGDEDFLPARQSFIRVILTIFAKIKDKRAASMADNCLRQMLDLAAAKQDASFLPPQSVFQHLLTLFSMSHEKDAGEHAEALLLRHQELKSANPKDNNLPPLKFFELVMQSWANSTHKKGASRVEKILSIVKKHFGKDGEEPLPPSFGYLQLIQAWSRSHHCDPYDDTPYLMVEKYFQEFQVHFGSKEVSSMAIVLAYKARIDAWLLCTNAAKAAREIQSAFDDLVRLRKNGTITLDPGPNIYTAVANGWARAGNTSRVQAILNQMTEETGRNPNISFYNQLLLAFSRSKEPKAAEQAEELLFELEHLSQQGDRNVKPDARSYSIVMNALSNSPNPETASRAELYLQKLKEMYETSGDPDLKPDKYIYTTAIRSLARQRSREAVQKAQELLDEMHELAREGDKSVKPTKVTYAVFLKLLRTTDVPNKSQRAKDTLSLMKQNGIQPDAFVIDEMKKIG